MAINIRASKTNNQRTVISVDPLYGSVRFCTAAENEDVLLIHSEDDKVLPFDNEFLDRLSLLLQNQIKENPNMETQKISLVLPDQLFLLDTISVPVIHRKAMQHSLSLAIESVYKHTEELNLITYSIQQNKQTATFGLVGIRRDVLDGIRKVFADNGATVTGVTYASNAMTNAAMALNPKLRGSTFLLLDIKDHYARFAFVVRGCTMGYYDLPFGYKIMKNTIVSTEDTLFDYRAGELLVLNAKERARAKQLTMEGMIDSAQSDPEAHALEANHDGSFHKIGRKLPKFMQRPAPQSTEEYIYENFRIFLKWSLDLIANNPQIVSLDKIDTVYVNMPDKYRFLFDIVNRKHAGRAITFAPLLPTETERNLADNLELYGGLFLTRYNEANTF